MAVTPPNLPPLRVDEETRCIQRSLTASGRSRAFDIIVAMAVTSDDIRRELLFHKPEVVHFCGHGVSSGGIVCEDPTGREKVLSAAALGNLFRLAPVKCVILNSCFSDMLAGEIVKHTEFVIAMKSSIGDRTAITFCRGFFDVYFLRKMITLSFYAGVNAIQLEDISKDSVPTIRSLFKDRLVGTYREQNPNDEKIFRDGRFETYPLSKTVVVYENPRTRWGAECDTFTTHELYYYPDRKDRKLRIKVGVYVTEWHFSEQKSIEAYGLDGIFDDNTITMVGLNMRRPGLDESLADLIRLQNGDRKMIDEYQAFIRTMRDAFHTARIELTLPMDRRLIMKTWYNEKKGEPDDVYGFLRN